MSHCGFGGLDLAACAPWLTFAGIGEEGMSFCVTAQS